MAVSVPAANDLPPATPVQAGREVPAAPVPWRWPNRQEWRWLALMLVVFAVRNLPCRLDDYDQAKQAFVSLEMVEGGQWWFQHTPGGRNVATKPPLIGWMSAAFYGLTGGNWELAWRLPSFLAAVALAVFLWREGERLWPGRGGTLAAAAFGFNLITPRLATLVRTDMPLALWITLVGLVVWHHVREGGRAWTPQARWTVFGLLVASFWTKGPIAYAFLLPGMAVLSWVMHRRGERWQLVWGGWWHWVLPLVPFAVWAERGMVTMPGFYERVVAREFLGRFTVGDAAVHRNQPFYFYFPKLFVAWLPWSVLLLAVRVRKARVWWSLCREAGTLWLICWAAGGLLCMTLVPSKRTDRVFPVVPPLCLVLTALLAAARRPLADGNADTPSAPPTEATWPAVWAQRTTTAAALIATGATLYAIADVYRTGQQRPAQFGANVRSATAGQRVELVTSLRPIVGEEAMIVYLRRLRFFPGDAAAKLAEVDQLNNVVVNQDDLGLTQGLLTPFDVAHPALTGAKYLLCVKPPPVPPRTPGKIKRR